MGRSSPGQGSSRVHHGRLLRGHDGEKLASEVDNLCSDIDRERASSSTRYSAAGLPAATDTPCTEESGQRDGRGPWACAMAQWCASNLLRAGSKLEEVGLNPYQSQPPARPSPGAS